MAALLSQRRDNNDKPRKIYDILRRTIKRAKQLSGRQLMINTAFGIICMTAMKLCILQVQAISSKTLIFILTRENL